MTQLFSDAARSELTIGAGAGATEFTIAPALNPYPTANTGPVPITDAADWFKLVVQDDDGYEIVYCRTHVSGTTTLSDIMRGQEGTTARAFAAGTVVGLRLTAQDQTDNKATGALLTGAVGDLAGLDTTDKSSLVAAINESLSTGDSALGDHKTSDDHDTRYYTKAEVDSALGDHKTSDDHDTRYYTKAEVDSALGNVQDDGDTALGNHKASDDHDTRYYTKAESDSALGDHKASDDHDTRYYTKTESDTALGLRDTALTNHKASGDHDTRYYTKAEVDSAVGGSTKLGVLARDWAGTLETSDGSAFGGAGNTYSANAHPDSTGTYNTVIGQEARSDSTGSVVFGGGASVSANSGAAFGNNTIVTAQHSVALGNRSRTYIDGVALLDTDRVVSIGYGEAHASYAQTRRLVNMTAPSHANDGANKAYVDTAVLNASTSLIINRHSTVHYTMTAGDAGALIVVEGADDKAVVVPPASDVPFPLGTLAYVCQLGAGRVLLVPGQGVTLLTPDGLYTAGPNLMVGITLIGPDEWLVTGGEE